jgi:aspartate-semialdehyde dehydrogenase
MKVAVVGATGLVGSKMLEVLAEQNFPVTELIPVASEKSKGTEIIYKGKKYKVVTVAEAVSMKPAVALFSAGAKVSAEWAPRFAQTGCVVIDNSSQWRMDPAIPLVVPEINADVITVKDKIIANPNCSTIQMVMVLNPIHKRYNIQRVVVSTYQSVSGTGAKGVKQLKEERAGRYTEKTYPHQIDLNCLPHIDIFYDNGFTKEEIKMVNETRKIMRAPDIKVNATTVRVPVWGGHSESVYVETAKPFEMNDITQMLKEAEGVIVQDDPKNNLYPMPINAEGKDEVFVGRLRRDLDVPNAFSCGVVADNLRKGAATNAVQIAKYMVSKGLIK